MAIRRRRKTLTNLLSTMERRVTAVELRPINLLTSSQVAAATAEEETLDPGPDSVVALNAPNQYKPITDGFYYSSNVAGKPRVELYFNGDPGLAKDKTIRISGINKLINNNNPVDFDISKDYKVLEVDEPPYNTGRNTYNGKRDTPAETVTATATFNPAISLSYGSSRRLAVKARISTVQATTTTATIVFSGPHYFEDNQVIYVDMPTDSPYYGIDGLFRIKDVVSSTSITYDFDAPLAEPINVANVTQERYVHAVAQSAIRDGATWFDTSQDPDVAYVWDDYRWVLFGSSSVADDNMPPAPVTELFANDENSTFPGSGQAQSEVILEWTAPTTNQDGTPLVDLYGYKIQSKQYPQQPWKTEALQTETVWRGGPFIPTQPASFRVFAVDSGNNESTPVEITHTPAKAEPVVSKPKAPAVTTYLGTIKVAYDDLTAFNLAQSPTAAEIEVYFSQQSGFTPGPTNFYGRFPANAGSYIIIPGTELTDGVDYYIKIIVRDIYGNITEASEQVSIRAKLSDIVTFDMIDVGTLTGQVIIGLDIRTNSNPSVNGGIVLNQQGMVAYSPPANGQPAAQTFRLNALDGSVSIGSYLGRSEANESFLTIASADLKYATIATAQGISFVAGNAKAVAEAAQSGVDAAREDLDAVTEIGAGSIRVIKRDKAIGAINGSTTDTTEINGGVIKTGTLSASKITTGTLDAGRVTVTNLNASNIETGTLTGRTVQTNSSGQRIVIDSSGASTGNRIRVFNTDGTQVGTIIGGATGSSGLRLIYVTGTEVNLFNNSVTMETSDASVRLSGAGTKASTRFTVDSQSLSLFPMAVAGNIWTVLQTFSTGSSTARNLSGTGTRNLNVDSTGLLTTVSSDLRKKKDIEDLNLSLDFINSLRPVTFRWKQPDKSYLELEKYGSVDSEDRVNMGLIAQELKQTLEERGLDSASIIGSDPAEFHRPYLEEGDNDPILSIDYPQLVPVLIKAVQELSARLEALERQKD